FFFFFQAEDGIRDLTVTGVQTCALPISTRGGLHRIDGDRGIETVRAALCAALGGVVRGQRRDRWHLFVEYEPVDDAHVGRWLGRSEERRVGKECGAWWAGGG